MHAPSEVRTLPRSSRSSPDLRRPEGEPTFTRSSIPDTAVSCRLVRNLCTITYRLQSSYTLLYPITDGLSHPANDESCCTIVCCTSVIVRSVAVVYSLYALIRRRVVPTVQATTLQSPGAFMDCLCTIFEVPKEKLMAVMGIRFFFTLLSDLYLRARHSNADGPTRNCSFQHPSLNATGQHERLRTQPNNSILTGPTGRALLPLDLRWIAARSTILRLASSSGRDCVFRGSRRMRATGTPSTSQAVTLFFSAAGLTCPAIKPPTTLRKWQAAANTSKSGPPSL